MEITPVISRSSLSRRFGKMTAVDGVSFSVQKGEIFGLIGSGKSIVTRVFARTCFVTTAYIQSLR